MMASTNRVKWTDTVLCVVDGIRSFKSGEYVPSKAFEIRQHSFQLFCAIQDSAENNDNFISCYLQYLGNEKIVISCVVSIVGDCVFSTLIGFSNGRSQSLCSLNNRTTPIDKWSREYDINTVFNRLDHIYVRRSINSVFAKNLNKVDISISIRLTLYDCPEDESHHLCKLCDLESPSLSQDMKSVLYCTTSDCTIVLQDETTIAVHKFMLCARSEVFRTMLNSNLSEGLTHVIEIKDVIPDVVRAFVKFLYTDECITNILAAHSIELFKLAHQYQVLGLLTMAEHRIVSTLIFSNALDCLELSILYKREYMKQNVIKFIAKHLKEFQSCDGFYSKIKALCSTGEVLEAIMRAM